MKYTTIRIEGAMLSADILDNAAVCVTISYILLSKEK